MPPPGGPSCPTHTHASPLPHCLSVPLSHLSVAHVPCPLLAPSRAAHPTRPYPRLCALSRLQHAHPFLPHCWPTRPSCYAFELPAPMPLGQQYYVAPTRPTPLCCPALLSSPALPMRHAKLLNLFAHIMPSCLATTHSTPVCNSLSLNACRGKGQACTGREAEEAHWHATLVAQLGLQEAPSQQQSNHDCSQEPAGGGAAGGAAGSQRSSLEAGGK